VRAWKAQGKRRFPVGSSAFNSQEFLIAMAEGKQSLDAIPDAPAARARRTSVAREQ
jgi:hypothetical protein